MSELDVSVIILSHGQAPLLRMALSHLEVQAHPAGRFEVLVVDARTPEEAHDDFEAYAAGAPIPMRRLFVDHWRNPGEARNHAMALARGRWVLFLDEDLLASPELVGEHVRLQERHGGACAALGAIRPHPQLPPGTVVKRFGSDPNWAPQSLEVVSWRDWRAFNLSLPLKTVRDAGGFNAQLNLPGLEDLELASRLAQSGVSGVYGAAATAFQWHRVDLDEEARRFYAEGYGLRRLEEQPGGEALRDGYAPLLIPLRRRLDRLRAPFCRRLCHALAAGAPIHTALIPCVLRNAFAAGYRDAGKGHPPRLPR